MNELTNELMHHGILGMKWGIRRYQPYGIGYKPSKDGKYLGPYVGKAASKSTPSKKSYDEIQKYRHKEFVAPFNKHLGYNKKAAKPKEFKELDEDVTVKKGKSIYHVTGKNEEQFNRAFKNNRRLFVSINDNDRKQYSGVFAASKVIRDNFNTTVNEIEMTLKKDLKAPSHKNQVSLFTEFYDKNPDTVIKTLSEVYDKYEGKGMEYWDNVIRNEFTRNDLQKDGYRTFIEGYGASGEAFSKDYFKCYDKFSDYIKSKGYNAVLDDNDRMGSYMRTEVPVILVDTVRTVGYKKIRELGIDEIYKNMTE